MSWRDHQVVAFTPYGRRETVQILLPYLRREHERGVLDEWQLWLNTDPSGQRADIRYARDLARRYPWVRCYDRPGSLPEHADRWPHMPRHWLDGPRHPKQLNTGRFYLYTQDRDTVYLRFDDDIVFVEDTAVRRLVDSELDRPEALATFPIIVNNAVATWYLQQQGKIPKSWGRVQRDCMDPLGWADPHFAQRLHEHTLDLIEQDALDQLHLYVPVQLGKRQQFSVSCFAIHGGEYADVRGVLTWDEEEHWLTMHRAGELDRKGVDKANIIAPDAVVSHLTFFPQRSYILEETDILDRYRKLARKVT